MSSIGCPNWFPLTPFRLSVEIEYCSHRIRSVRVILILSESSSPLSVAMGCTQSVVSGYVPITEADIQEIPLVFRDLNARYRTPGMRYWFDTCNVREGTLPLKVDVGATNGYVHIGIYVFGGIRMRDKVWILSRRAGSRSPRLLHNRRIGICYRRKGGKGTVFGRI